MVRRRRYRRKKKNALDYISLPRIDIDPDTRRGIFVMLIFAFGAICLLGLFDLAGVLGQYLANLQAIVFGWGKWLFPVILLTLGFFLYNDDKYDIKGTNYLGLFIFSIVFEALLHFFIEFGEWREMAAEGIGGGFFGYYIALAFHNILGFWGSLLLLLSLLVVSLLLLLDTTLTKLVGSESIVAKVVSPVKTVLVKIFGKREPREDDYEEEEFEEEDTPPEAGQAEDDEEIIEQGGIGFSKKAVSEEPDFMKEDVKKKITKPAIIIEEHEAGWKKSNIKIDLPLDLLSGNIGKPTSGDIKNNALIIQRTLENFGIMVEMGVINVGPTVTQYTFKPAEGVKLARITTLSNDLALALAAHPIRIEAPIPGKALVGIEVPNQSKAIVGIREILDAQEFKISKGHLNIALGKDVSGEALFYDITKMPHLLVAGATNSGKSVCLNTIIISLLYQHNPDDLKFIMVDPKRVELPIYNGIPHLLTPVITNVPKTINALKWCLNEMDRRFEILSKCGKKNIQDYNKGANNPRRGDAGKMPYLVFIIDELADLMVAASKDIEGSVIRLAQMARAVGIHLILATQRPSVDVITGLIKANMPARIAFSVASAVDSKTILDSLGAEKLLGQGDMLFITAEISKPKRIQGAYVSDNEIRKICNFIKSKSGEPNYLEDIVERQKVKGIAGVGLDGDMDEDDLLGEAKEVVISMGKASASLLQRRLRVGYARAASIIDQLEELGVVGPSNGSKPREILITEAENNAMTSPHPSPRTGEGEIGISGVSVHNRDEAEAPENYLGGEQSEGGVVMRDDRKHLPAGQAGTTDDSDEMEEDEENSKHLPAGQAGTTDDSDEVEEDDESADAGSASSADKAMADKNDEADVGDKERSSASLRAGAEDENEEEEIVSKITISEKKPLVEDSEVDEDDDDEEGMFFSK